MKRLMIVLALGFVVAAAVSSCKTHERCPAYGSVEVEAVEARS